jgi:hypothetical protein
LNIKSGYSTVEQVSRVQVPRQYGGKFRVKRAGSAVEDRASQWSFQPNKTSMAIEKVFYKIKNETI